MKIPQVRAEWTDGLMDRYIEANSCFSQFCTVPSDENLG
jgi:hypothetical protein